MEEQGEAVVNPLEEDGDWEVYYYHEDDSFTRSETHSQREEPETQSVYLPGTRRNTAVFYDGRGYYYHRDNEKGKRRHLRCARYGQGCRARAAMDRALGSPIALSKKSPLHNHAPNNTTRHVKEYRQRIRERSRRERVPLQTILQEESLRYPEATGNTSFRNLMRAMQRARNSELGSERRERKFALVRKIMKTSSTPLDDTGIYNLPSTSLGTDLLGQNATASLATSREEEISQAMYCVPVAKNVLSETFVNGKCEIESACAANLEIPGVPENLDVDVSEDHYTEEYMFSSTKDASLTSAETKKEDSYEICGRRIIDVSYFLQQIVDIDEHPITQCSFKHMRLLSERRRGLQSLLTFKCSMCNIVKVVKTNDDTKLTMDVNTSAVVGTICTGGGHNQLEEICSAMNIPSMSYRTYQKYHDTIADGWEKTAHHEMAEAAKLEIQEAIKRGHVDENGIPLLTVVVDGSSPKRSYHTNYNSLSGMAAIVGFYTKKVIFIGVKNKYCSFCHRAEVRSETPKEHTCFKNWNSDQSSSSMEAAIIAEGFLSSMDMYGCIYAKVIADGDCSVYKKILESRPYTNYTVEKIECRNHLLRNYCNKIRSSVGITGKTCYPHSLRQVVDRNVGRLRGAVKKAILYRKNSNCPNNIEELRKDILNSPDHVFGHHENCKERGYFCDGTEKRKNMHDQTEDLKQHGLYQQIQHYNRLLSLHSRSLIENVDSNPAEHFNSAVAKLLGGKRINFVCRRSYQARCSGAVVQHNTGRLRYKLHKTMYGKSPGKYAKLSEERRKKKVERERKNRKGKAKCVKSLLNKTSQFRGDYGTNAAKPDLDENVFKNECQTFLKDLRLAPKERHSLERGTLLQQGSSLWLEERRKRLTASNFGVICKRRPHTSCERLVKQMLYGHSPNTPPIQHGKVNEERALREVENETRLKISQSGLFIHADIPFLGATPDGLLDDSSGIVEVKCPYGIMSAHPTDAIMAGKFPAVKFLEGNYIMNQKHNYYYQVQGQLQITKKDYCIFSIWTPLGLHTIRVERDDNFWENEMKEKLCTFYMECLLPEIVDPRFPRSMPIRNPKSIEEAQRNRLAKTARKK